ncbi:glycerophosphodiester phosphodiesterase [Lentzea xinjiangensis]|uniref:glycerophosphodiester phosphodiesterase n=1 Tax=Lentzea xinjiangensis TaxID=402600 RepID=UPI001FE9A880|nr:glycerophosphodiester phosphodiesterase family protein [Lentzea xinjiangensis]
MQPPSIIAHRGASTDRPEHTIGAYELALQEGADGLECDIRLSRDGEIVCVHDGTLSRTSNGRGRVSALSLEELRKFDYGTWHRHGQAAGLLVLDELLDLVKGTGVQLFVETKHPVRYRNEVERKLVEALKRHRLDEQIVMMSFSAAAVRVFRKMAPDVRTVQLVSWYRGGAMPSFAHCTGPNVRLLRNDPGYVERARRAGLETYVWTVDSPEDIALCRDLGVRYLATNAPANTRHLLAANLAA